MNDLNKDIVKAAEAFVRQQRDHYWDEPDYSALEEAVEAKWAAKARARLPDGCEFDGFGCTAGSIRCSAIHAKAQARKEALEAAAEDCDDEPKLPCYILDGDGDCSTCHQWAGFGCPKAPIGSEAAGPIFGHTLLGTRDW